MSYAKELSVFADLEQEVRSKRNRLALQIDTRLVQETPVDTSEARSAWLISDGRPNDTDVNHKNAGVALAEGAGAINSAKTFTQLYIQNTKPYIEELNEGSSLQAPAKYIDRIIEQEVNREQ